MSITDPSDDIQAYVTDSGRQYLARSFVGQLAFKAIGFSAGRGGYNPVDPVHILPVETTDTALMDQVYPDVIGQAPFAGGLSIPNDVTFLTFNCRMPATPLASNADFGLGELGLWAQIVKSNNPLEVGLIFLFGLAHFPIRAKTHRDVFLPRVVLQL